MLLGKHKNKALRILFDLLDYAVWQSAKEPWELMAEHLHDIHDR